AEHLVVGDEKEQTEPPPAEVEGRGAVSVGLEVDEAMHDVQGDRRDDQIGLLDLSRPIPGGVHDVSDLGVFPKPQLINPRDETYLTAVAEETLLEDIGDVSDASRGV